MASEACDWSPGATSLWSVEILISEPQRALGALKLDNYLRATPNAGENAEALQRRDERRRSFIVVILLERKNFMIILSFFL